MFIGENIESALRQRLDQKMPSSSGIQCPTYMHPVVPKAPVTTGPPYAELVLALALLLLLVNPPRSPRSLADVLVPSHLPHSVPFEPGAKGKRVPPISARKAPKEREGIPRGARAAGHRALPVGQYRWFGTRSTKRMHNVDNSIIVLLY